MNLSASGESAPIGWYADPLWAFVGVLAQLLSLAAIGFALWEIRKQRRWVSPVVWGFDLVGSATLAEGKFHLADFYNSGTGTAVITAITFVGARFFPTEEHRFQTVMGSGERVKVFITSPKIDESWLMITYKTHSDYSRAFVHWLALAPTGEVRESWEGSYDRTKRWRSSLGSFPQAVGPGAYVRTSITVSGREKTRTRRLNKAWAVAIGLGIDVHTWGLTQTPIADLPEVKLPSKP